MDVLTRLATIVERLAADRDRVLVGIDGPDAAGKTTLARALVERLGPVARSASVDDFQHSWEVRRARGDLSPEGYYRDAFDHESLISLLLDPFRRGAPTVVTALRDYRSNELVKATPVTLPKRAVLVVDGVFLQRPPLGDMWSLAVYVVVPVEESIRRGVTRDLDLWASQAQALQRYRERYMPAQAIYRAEMDPEARADIVIDNTDPAYPQIRCS
jgi:uridine kinase